MLLNEYRLQPWTREAQDFLVEQMNGFFFGEGEAIAAEGVCGADAVAPDGLRAGRGRVHLELQDNPSVARPGLTDANTVGTWLSLVERTLGVGEVASSNLVVPTI